jgi:D-inositol-3-phosphate glycosyltransferase
MRGEPTRSTEVQGRLAVFFPSGQTTLGPNPFGKDVANLQLWQALARHAGYAQLDVLTAQAVDQAEVARGLIGDSGSATRVTTAHHALSRAPMEAGALLRGQPDLSDLAWSRRRRASDRAYSLLGVIHTLAPPAIRQIIAAASTAPMHPWDALICTSPSVRDAVESMLAGWETHLVERTGGRAPPRPLLPIIPLGVDAQAFAAQADRPEARARARAAFDL